MTIRDIDLYISELWDWAILDGCFSATKISATDIDGAVERNGNLLIIETKMPDQPIPNGQRIMFDNLRRAKTCHIIIVWGHRNNPVALQVWGEDAYDADINELRARIAAWFNWANQHPKWSNS